MIPERRMFIDEQRSFDLAVACLQEADSWEALRDALERVAAFDPQARVGPAKVGGLGIA